MIPADPTPFAEAPGFTFFHTRQWLDGLLTTFPRWRDLTQIIALPDGRRVLLPLLETDRVGSWRWREAMPFGFFGGPVAEAGDLDGADLAFIMRAVGRGAGWLALNLDPCLPLSRPGVVTVGAVPTTTHLLALDGGFAAVADGFSPMVHRHVRRAEKEGIVVRRGQGRADFLVYYALSALAGERWGLSGPPYPRPLYEALADLPAGRVCLWLAECRGEPVGALISLHYAPGKVMYWGSAMHPAHTHLSPTRLLQVEAIRAACASGAAVYNMGPSAGFDGRLLDGVRRAKEALGARPHDYTIAILMNPWAMRARALRDRASRLLRES